METYLDNVKAAKEGGVRIGTGTDTNNPKMIFGRSVHRELELLVQAGLTPGEALLSATGDAARALRVDKDLGTVEPNKLADLVLVEGQPWEQITDIGKIQLVIQAGRVVVDKRTSAR
ncbi:MAG: amidohydrolase family protein [Planctomycetes bacterium]|nr:amidohydrolase family protein [Planctomycetota bacterium]